jgi:hypothetical protein
LCEPALINREERNNTFLDLLSILRSNVGCVPSRGAQVQCIATVSTAASKKEIAYIIKVDINTYKSETTFFFLRTGAEAAIAFSRGKNSTEQFRNREENKKL